MKNTTLCAALVFTLASDATAQSCGTTFVEGFTDFSNVGGWVTSGVFQAGVGSGGVPGFYLLSQPAPYSKPELRSTQPSPYTGDYAALGVTSLGVDFQTFIDDGGACVRRLTLILENDGGTPSVPSDDRFVFFLSNHQVPCADGTWHSYTIDVPSQMTTLPPGWGVDPGSPLLPDATWDLVIHDVTSVRWSYGDPVTMYAPTNWQYGADNPRVSYLGGPTTYCTTEVNSQLCAPGMEWAGAPSASSGSPFFVTAAQVINNQNGLLFYGSAPVAIPFQGGFLCVAPPVKRTVVQFSMGNPPPDDCSGVFFFNFNGWIQSGQDPTLVPGATVFAQYWSRDPAAPSGTSLSNALRFSICP